MICLIFGDTDLPNKILRNIVKQKVKYFIIDLSKKIFLRVIKNQIELA